MYANISAKQKIGHVCTTSKKVEITANTVVFDTSTVKVPLAKFRRTAMIVPTPEAETLHNLCFVSSCFVIPANVSTVDVPYRVWNISSSYVVLQKKCILYITLYPLIVGVVYSQLMTTHA